MQIILTFGFALSTFLYLCWADVYLHFPPGSNNRLNGNKENVDKDDRLFDSQNNGKGGYNVGDSGTGTTGNKIPKDRQLPLEFFMSGSKENAKTEVEIMWTNQHGTGTESADIVESQIILQYMCQEVTESKYKYPNIRNGEERDKQNFNAGSQENNEVKMERGLHEPLEYYRTYRRRERNKDLFTANQDLEGNSAIYTRQNPDGKRRGFEVPEERDYYPYWGPTPWKDIAILVSDSTTKSAMRDHVNRDYGKKWLCIIDDGVAKTLCPKVPQKNKRNAKCVARFITQDSCQGAGGSWTQVQTNFIEKFGSKDKGVAYEPHLITQGTGEGKQGLVLADSPEVLDAPSTVVNHNGMNMDGKFSSYKWKIPHFPSNTPQRCVLRIRYNITTKDVPRTFTVSNNDGEENNPKTLAVDGKTKLQLALNTTQLGRTFQDRSHVIHLKPRSSLLQKFQNSKIFYIGGMGKRGNIVQTYPAMEYRFTPESITVSRNDVLCFAWSGSNDNPDNEGQGKKRSDRTNVCWVKEGCQSLKPKACASLPLEVVEQADKFSADKLNLHLNTGCYSGNPNKLNVQLDNAPASCNPPCFRITKSGTYCYMSTRNNNFSNRRHMGQITVN
nr:protein DD3-3-like [Pocillopora verrucosa]